MTQIALAWFTLCCLTLYLPYVECNHILSLLWSNSLDAINDGNWIINGSVHDIHSNHCPTSMDCCKLGSSTDSTQSSITTSITTQHYHNLTLSFGITIFDTLSSQSTLQNESFSHRNYCRIYYKINQVQNWTLLTSYFFNITDPFANKLPLQSYILPFNDHNSIDIRFVNSVNDAEGSVSCYIDEISLSAEYDSVPSQSTGNNTILIVFIVVTVLIVFLCLIICAVLSYVRFVKIKINKATVTNIQTAKNSNSEIQRAYVDSISCGLNAASPSLTTTANGGAAPISAPTPISTVSPEHAIPLSTVKPTDDTEATPSPPLIATTEHDTSHSTGIEVKSTDNIKATAHRNTTHQLMDIMQEVLSSPSNDSYREHPVNDIHLTSYDLYDGDREEEKRKTVATAPDINVNHETVLDINVGSNLSSDEYINAQKRDSDSLIFESYDHTYTQREHKEHNEQNSLSFAEDFSIQIAIQSSRLSSKPEAMMYKRSGASSMRSSTNIQSNDNNDASVVYSYDGTSTLNDEKSNTFRKPIRKYTQNREEESLDIGSGPSSVTGSAADILSGTGSTRTSNIYLNDIPQYLPQHSLNSNDSKLRKSKSATEISQNTINEESHQL